MIFSCTTRTLNIKWVSNGNLNTCESDVSFFPNNQSRVLVTTPFDDVFSFSSIFPSLRINVSKFDVLQREINMLCANKFFPILLLRNVIFVMGVGDQLMIAERMHVVNDDKSYRHDMLIRRRTRQDGAASLDQVFKMYFSFKKRVGDSDRSSRNLGRKIEGVSDFIT